MSGKKLTGLFTAMIIGCLLTIASPGKAEPEEKKSEVHVMMEKVVGPNWKAIAAELKKESPDWDLIAPAAKKATAVAPDLIKNKEFGNEETWKKSALALKTHTPELHAAIKAKDQLATQAVMEKLSKTSCSVCHAEYRIR
jgi:cytochrome c556